MSIGSGIALASMWISVGAVGYVDTPAAVLMAIGATLYTLVILDIYSNKE